MIRDNWKAAYLLLLPALAWGQTTDAPPVRHDSVEVHDTTPGVAATASPATTVKPADVKDLPTRPATVNDALPLLARHRSRARRRTADQRFGRAAQRHAGESDGRHRSGDRRFRRQRAGGQRPGDERIPHAVPGAVWAIQFRRGRGGDPARQRQMAFRAQRSAAGFPFSQLETARACRMLRRAWWSAGR